MKKISLISAGIAGIAAVGVFVAPGLVSAQSGNAYGAGGRGYGYQQALETKAQVLNMTKEELQTQLQEKTMLQVIEDQGLTHEQFQDGMETAAQSRWQERGLSDEEITERTQAREERQADCGGTGGSMRQYRGSVAN